MNEKMMNEGHEYFANQEEEISNKYMSANGKGDNARKHKEKFMLPVGFKMLFLGLSAYIGYRVFIKKK